MHGSLPKMFDVLNILLYRSSTQGPTMVGSGGKFLNLRSPNAWKMLFWNHLMYIKCKKFGAIWSLKYKGLSCKGSCSKGSIH